MRDWAGGIVPRDRVPPGWGCQKAIAPQSRAPGAASVLAVQEHPKHLHDRLDDTFGSARSPAFQGCPHDYVETVGQDQGRIETRWCGVMGASDYCQYVDPEPAWADLQSLVMVVSERRRGATVTRYFISSCPPRAKALRAAVRGHWSIENSMHWVLEVAFQEDDSCIRRDQAPHNMAILRCRALNLLRQETTPHGGGPQTPPGRWGPEVSC